MKCERVKGYPLDHEEECKAQVMRGRGELATLMRNLDWSRLPTGPVSTWTEALRTAVSICLGSAHAVEIWWGPQYLRFYNDAYRPILGEAKHPQFIGRPGQEMWAEIWDVIQPLLDKVVATGEAIWYEDFQLFLTRNNYVEETYFSFSYGPVFEQGKVAGVFSPCTETTAHVLQNRRLLLLRQLSVEGTAETITDAIHACTRLLGDDALDVPFALIYLFDPSAGRAHLASTAGLDADSLALFPETVDLSTTTVFGDIAGATGPIVIKDVDTRFGPIVTGPWNQQHKRAVALPLRRTSGDILGFLVAGVSARLPYNDEYRVFFDLLAAQISNVIARSSAFLEQRHRAEALASMFNSAPAFIAILRGPTHVFEFANPRYLQIVGHSDILGKPIRTALPELEQQGFIQILDNVYATGQPFHGDSIKAELQRTDGSPPETRYVTFVNQPLIEADGYISGIFVLGSDVTENFVAHEALRRSEKLSAAGRLAATIAHEVNNPLEAMTNLLYLARDGASEESVGFLSMAEDELDRIAHITKQTLAFYKESTAPAVFDLSTTVETIAMFYRKQAGSRGVDILTHLAAGSNITGVEGEIKQVLSNLISNAIDAFAGERGNIQIRTRTTRDGVRLTIADNASGVPPHALAKIWEPFFTTKESVGTGLGLWVTREIVTKHHGRLRLRTTHGGPRHGTIFAVDFPPAVAVPIPVRRPHRVN